MTPTPEQQAIIDKGRGSPRSLLITAYAGAAKTTTLCLLAAKLPLVPTLCLAFNKRTAEDMAKRMPSHVQCSTLNSLGHRVWQAKVGRGRLSVDADKCYDLLKGVVESYPATERARLGEAFASLLRTIRLAKSAGYIPKKMAGLGEALTTQDELTDSIASQLEVNPDTDFWLIVDRVLELSIAQAFEGKVDYDDQIYMSTLFGGAYPSFPIVMVDEAQDLSPLNHRTLALMRPGRLIAVGDPWQSIYAFRGAEHGSMEHLREAFDMEEMELSVSFRCPIEVVKRAQATRVPNMKWADQAIQGKVEFLDEWTLDEIPEHAVVLCRNNAPLFSLALKMLKGSRSVKLVGRDIGAGLLKIMNKLGPNEMRQEAVLSCIAAWEDDETAKAHRSRKAAIRDRAECLRVFALAGQTLAESIAYAKLLFASVGTVQLMTGHGAKGAEFDKVFHLNPYLIPSRFALEAAANGSPGQLDQERNLAYVILTRAKREYTELSMEGLV